MRIEELNGDRDPPGGIDQILRQESWRCRFKLGVHTRTFTPVTTAVSEMEKH